MTYAIMPCFTMLCLCVSTVAGADRDLATVEQHIIQKWQQYSSVRAKLTVDMTIGEGMTSRGNGFIEYVVEDDHEKYRMKLDTEIELAGQAVTMSRLTVCDGKVVHVLADQLGQQMITRQTPNQFDGRLGGAKMMAQLHRDNTLTLQKDAKIKDEAVFVIEATSRTAKGGQPARTELYFSKNSGAILKMVGYDVSTQPTITMTYYDYAFNPIIPAQHFVFQAPEGVPIMDQTRP